MEFGGFNKNGLAFEKWGGYFRIEFCQEIIFAEEGKSLIRFFFFSYYIMLYLKMYRTKSETPYLPSNAFSCFSLLINTWLDK